MFDFSALKHGVLESVWFGMRWFTWERHINNLLAIMKRCVCVVCVCVWGGGGGGLQKHGQCRAHER